MQIGSFTARPRAYIRAELHSYKRTDGGTLTVDGRMYAVRLTEHAGQVRATLVPLVRTFQAKLDKETEKALIEAWIEFAKL